ncbi:Hypothetical protein R9X50_00355900 [Acrodontium crateriforme]|uniref:General alpha-glucoside permease n=1 Tax=Acrodontium crateriforme TaxID=150365 RepID=A0AAQ3M3M0_9PEZI|nr:Hypothetical protein R9X50_00355900 [Acrodontium crateriforme]
MAKKQAKIEEPTYSDNPQSGDTDRTRPTCEASDATCGEASLNAGNPTKTKHAVPSNSISGLEQLLGRQNAVTHGHIHHDKNDRHHSADAVVVDENSPLIPSQRTEIVDDLPGPTGGLSSGSSDTWVEGDDQIAESKSSWYLFLLTLSIGGLQIAWSVELSNGSPYLLSLGIDKSFLALVWIAGPLSGALVQPYIGIKSDQCRSRFGKRRPFMMGGAIATIVSLMLLAWTREIVGGVLHIFGVPRESDTVARAAIVFAVLLIYILDFAVNVVQAAIRAFIVDNAPTHQQDDANAWASRLTGVGNIIGYSFGYVDLPKYLWFFGNTQFKILCVVASAALLITILISCIKIQERNPRLEGDQSQHSRGMFAFFTHLWHAIRRLPPQIRKICIVQCWAWLGWFPFLFYTTTYIAEIYIDSLSQANPNMTLDEIDKAWEKGTRVGTFALLMFALVTFMTSVLLPFFVAKTYRTPLTPEDTAPTTSILDSIRASQLTYNPTSPSYKLGFPSGDPVALLFDLRDQLPRSVELSWFTLRRAWMFSHLVFTLLTWSTFFISTTKSATVLVALIGIPWAITSWAPFALIAAEISKRDAIRRGLERENPEDQDENPQDRDDELLARGEDDSDGAYQAGTVLGIHNVAIAAPQIVATLVSSGIFHALQKPRGAVGDKSVAWVLRFGGCAALVAAWYTKKVAK